jgi:hypothetical protein
VSRRKIVVPFNDPGNYDIVPAPTGPHYAGLEGPCMIWRHSSDGRHGTVLIGTKKYLTHRLAWEKANRQAVPDGMQVLHRCDRPACIAPSHLRVGTHQDNMDDKVVRGRQPRGVQSRQAKLTEEQVRQVRSAPGRHADIARRFGISADQVGTIKRREQWQHVELLRQGLPRFATKRRKS